MFQSTLFTAELLQGPIDLSQASSLYAGIQTCHPENSKALSCSLGTEGTPKQRNTHLRCIFFFTVNFTLNSDLPGWWHGCRRWPTSASASRRAPSDLDVAKRGGEGDDLSLWLPWNFLWILVQARRVPIKKEK